jgi:hypothetical protein
VLHRARWSLTPSAGTILVALCWLRENLIKNAITFAVIVTVYGCCPAPAQLDLHTLHHALRSQVPAALCFWQRSKHVQVLLVRTRGQRYLQLVRFSKERSTKSRFLFSDCRKIDFDCAGCIELRQVPKDVRDNLVVLACTPVCLRKRDAWKMRGGCLTAFLLVHRPVLSEIELTMSGAVNHTAMLFERPDIAQT